MAPADTRGQPVYRSAASKHKIEILRRLKNAPALLIISSCELQSEYPTTALASLKVTCLLSLHHTHVRDQSLRFRQKSGTRSCETRRRRFLAAKRTVLLTLDFVPHCLVNAASL